MSDSNEVVDTGATNESTTVDTTTETVDTTVESTEVDQAALNAAVEKYKLKNADGSEIEVDLEELKRGYQRDDAKMKAAQKRFQEAAKTKKQIEMLLAKGKENPEELLRRLGVNVDDFINQRVNAIVDDARLTPEERERRQLESELQKYKSQEEAMTRKQQEEAQRIEFEKHAKDYSTQITNALDAVQIPKTANAAKRVAQYMHAALVRKVEISALEAAQLVREDYLSDVKSLLGGADDATITALLGEEVAKKLVKSNLASIQKAKLPGGVPNLPVTKAPQKAPKQDEKPFDRDAWRASLRAKL